MAPRALVLLPDRDHGPGDYTGAFRVEADRLLHHYRLPSSAAVQVDISRDDGARARQVLAAIEEAGQAGPLELLAFICHGTRRGLQLARLAQLPGLAARIASSAAPGVAIAFYACSLGGGVDGPAGAGGDGGPADFLRDTLSRCVGVDGQPFVDFHVDAHTTAGHCCSNPYVRRFSGRLGGDVGGAWLVEPGSALWPAWMRELEDRHRSTLRLRYPLMTIAELHEELRRGPG